jgi:hypothetical protein
MSESNHTCHGCRELAAQLEALVPLIPLIEDALSRPASAEVLDAAGVAERYGLSREYVYRNATRLGAWKVGDGPRPRWRFDAAEVEAALRGPAPQPRRASSRNRGAQTSSTRLLPIKGRGAELMARPWTVSE